MSKEKQIVEEMRKDLIEIFDEEYEKRRIVTADFTAIKMTAKGYRKQSEWISVEERLPEREGYYLTSTIKGVIMIGAFFGYYASGDRPQFKYDVTHWMPLPEAPKGGE